VKKSIFAVATLGGRNTPVYQGILLFILPAKACPALIFQSIAERFMQ
jgi:hypothetical protein